MLCGFALVLVKNEVAERVENISAAIPFVSLNHVRMVADYQRSARVDGSVCELDLLSIRVRDVLDAAVHRHDHDIAPLLQLCDIAGDHNGISHCDTVIKIAPVAVLLIERVAEKSEPHSAAFYHHAGMCFFGRFAGPYGKRPVRAKPIYSELHSVRTAVARMVIGGRDDIDSRKLQSGDC